ncbi:MAG: redoxin domain-containing protein [Planctomycetota bacterium]
MLAIILSFAASLLQNAEPSPRAPLALGPAPNFTLPSLRELKLVTKNDFAGKVVFLDIWRTDCQQCQRESEYIVSLRKKFVDRGFEILCVADENFDARSEPAARVLQYAKEHHFEFPIVLNDGGEFHAAYYQRIRGTPCAYLIKRDGTLEFLGQDPARPEYREDLEKRIDNYLNEPVPPPVDRKVEVRALPDFTLLSIKGGSLKSSDLRGSPAVIALLSTRMTARYGPTLSTLATKYNSFGLRVLGVTFGTNREIMSDYEKQRPSYEVMIPDVEAQEALLGADSYLPKFLFVTPEGKILKSITTVYGPQAGIESAVFERYASLIIGKDAQLPELVDPAGMNINVSYRHPELGFGLNPPAMYKMSDRLDGAKVRYMGPGSQEFKVVFEQRYGSDAKSADRVAELLGENAKSRQIESRAWQEVNGYPALFMRESTASPAGIYQSLRLLMPVPSGIYIVTASAPSAEFTKDSAVMQAALLSFHPGSVKKN